MTEYVAGFLFHECMEFVLLVRKQRPKWQAGRLNAIGGHVEEGEVALDAMVREFREETGLEIYDWQPLACLNGTDLDGHTWKVHFYYSTTDTATILSAKSVDEPIGVYGTKHTGEQLPNLAWLIPMAQSLHAGIDRAHYFSITEKYESAGEPDHA